MKPTYFILWGSKLETSTSIVGKCYNYALHLGTVQSNLHPLHVTTIYYSHACRCGEGEISHVVDDDIILHPNMEPTSKNSLKRRLAKVVALRVMNSFANNLLSILCREGYIVRRKKLGACGLHMPGGGLYHLVCYCKSIFV